MIFLYIIAVACGFFAKLADNLVDLAKKPRKKWVAPFAGALYGFAAGCLIFSSVEFATVLIAMALGTLVAGKIDARPHQIALAIMLLAILLAMPKIFFPTVLFFAGLALLDELLNDIADKAKAAKSLLKRLAGARLSMEIGAVAFWAATGNYGYLLAIIAFDAGYWAAKKLWINKRH